MGFRWYGIRKKSHDKTFSPFKEEFERTFKNESQKTKSGKCMIEYLAHFPAILLHGSIDSKQKCLIN